MVRQSQIKMIFPFKVEWYETLSKACQDCPESIDHCSRSHCVSGDGIHRSIMTINRMMPGPLIDVCKDDIIVIDVENNLLGESTTIHWHGLHQYGSEFSLCCDFLQQKEVLLHLS